MVMIYGDHYGLSNSENQTLAPIIDESSDTWNTFNNVQMQKVPFMVHSANLHGYLDSNVSGEIDVLPTLLSLLGIKHQDYLQFGQNVFSPNYQKWIVFRNGTIVSQKYVIVGGKGIKGTVYDRQSGREIIHYTAQEKKEITELSLKARDSLKYSDLLNNHNLLRYYTPAGFEPVDPSHYDYLSNYKQMLDLRAKMGRNSTSLYSKNKASTTKFYKTDATQLRNRQTEITQVPANVKNNNLDKPKSSDNN